MLRHEACLLQAGFVSRNDEIRTQLTDLNS
jgi:hypothetical protein